MVAHCQGPTQLLPLTDLLQLMINILQGSGWQVSMGGAAGSVHSRQESGAACLLSSPGCLCIHALITSTYLMPYALSWNAAGAYGKQVLQTAP